MGRIGRSTCFNSMGGARLQEAVVRSAPVSNDIAPTFANFLVLKSLPEVRTEGTRTARGAGGRPGAISFVRRTAISQGAPNGKTTILMYQQLAQQAYSDQTCFKLI